MNGVLKKNNYVKNAENCKYTETNNMNISKYGATALVTMYMAPFSLYLRI